MSILRKRCVGGLGVVAAILSGGCPSESFEHGDPPSASTSTATFTSAGGGFGESGSPNVDGNYPEPAISRCGDVLGTLPPIQGLASAWAVVAVPDATVDGEPVATGSVLLRVSQEAIGECGDAPSPLPPSGTGSSSGGPPWRDLARGFEVLLAPDELVLGVHEVDGLTPPRVAVFGDGATIQSAAEANIELLHVDDDCIIGVARGFLSDTGEPFMYGGFVAQTCQRQCIPTQGRPC